MKGDYGPDFITVTDEEGNEFELEHLGTVKHWGTTYMCFVPADMDEDDEDYGMIILKVVEENGEEFLADVDDREQLDFIYDKFIDALYEEDNEDSEDDDEDDEEDE